MTPATDRNRLLELVRREALLRGTFKLSSGGTSDVYLDCRRVTLHPEGCALTATLLLDWARDAGLAVDCVGGPTLGADPVVAGMAALSFQRGTPLPGFLVRKEAKGHGAGNRLEGQWQAGWRALMVEDTVTTGRSLLEAARAVEEAGLSIAAVACLVDRRDDRAPTLGPYPFHALFTFEEVVGG